VSKQHNCSRSHKVSGFPNLEEESVNFHLNTFTDTVYIKHLRTYISCAH